MTRLRHVTTNVVAGSQQLRSQIQASAVAFAHVTGFWHLANHRLIGDWVNRALSPNSRCWTADLRSRFTPVSHFLYSPVETCGRGARFLGRSTVNHASSRWQSQEGQANVRKTSNEHVDMQSAKRKKSLKRPDERLRSGIERLRPVCAASRMKCDDL